MNTTILSHPIISHKVTLLRKTDTASKDFRILVSEIATMMAYEATRDLELQDVSITTPLQQMTGKEIAGKKLVLVPILRAGLGMLDGVLTLLPSARVGHIGLARDHETLQPIKYYYNMPKELDKRDVLVLDPMLATGGSASAAIDFLKADGCKRIKLLCVLGAPEGVARIEKDHPDVQIYIAELDERLNEHGYILPGLGDAGDRIFATK
ncbi:uracil phosphoribosyltransferase [Bengtsoniella intestinalis]|uniref:uracil phosphoribosyltransferase n=1 Tax=Bengtsoniella intestinalis TaxID=3073143 RepID=UPI00391F8ABD